MKPSLFVSTPLTKESTLNDFVWGMAAPAPPCDDAAGGFCAETGKEKNTEKQTIDITFMIFMATPYKIFI